MQAVTITHISIDELEGMFKRVLSENLPKEDLSNKRYSLKEASELLDLTPQTLRARIKSGSIKGERTGRKFLIPHTELFDSLQEVKSLKYKRD